jgi:hypothetical protein
MDIIIPDDRPTAAQRALSDQAEGKRPRMDVTGRKAEKSALEMGLSDFQRGWLLDYCVMRWLALHGQLSTWRAEMTKWEEMSEDDYTCRIGQADEARTDNAQDIFSVQNHTLGMASGFADFASAQAKDDILGTRPWLAATPEGRDDRNLAERITKHAQWKINHSNLETVFQDAIKTACWGGTAFAKVRWHKEIEETQKVIQAAHLISTGEALLGPDGDYIQEAEAIPAEIDGADIEWKEQLVTDANEVHNNVSAALLDFNDIAFDAMAPDLCLSETDVFCRFRMGLLDVMAAYNIPERMHGELRNAIVSTDEEARDHRGESVTSGKSPGVDEDDANPPISLIEGFIRIDPRQKGKPVRIHVIFCPILNALFSCDYLANITPGGLLPVFPVRVHKIPRRVFGRGYFEKYEDCNNIIDRQYNAVTYRNRLAANVITAFQPSALRDSGEGEDYTIDQSKPFELAEGKSITDLVGFATIPDVNNRAIELMNQALQMGQMRSGITSAAQGELKGVPNASTATGVAQIQSRGALLLKDPIDQISSDLQKPTEFSVLLIYANQDRDETFVWGEGKDAELLEIVAGDVKGLRANVSLTLVQAQNQGKLASAQAAIGIAAQYAQLPEPEKVSQRILYVQAISSLGFHEADEIIRQAVVDPAGILALVPPEMQQAVMAGLQAAGVAPPMDEAGGAPAGAPVAPQA